MSIINLAKSDPNWQDTPAMRLISIFYVMERWYYNVLCLYKALQVQTFVEFLHGKFKTFFFIILIILHSNIYAKNSITTNAQNTYSLKQCTKTIKIALYKLHASEAFLWIYLFHERSQKNIWMFKINKNRNSWRVLWWKKMS